MISSAYDSIQIFTPVEYLKLVIIMLLAVSLSLIFLYVWIDDNQG
jgi:hypothetical protein